MQPENPQQGPQQYTPAPFAPNPFAQYSPTPGPQVPIAMPKDKKPLGLILSLALSVVFLLGAVGFGAWAFMSRQDYKANVDKKIATAVVVAKKQESTAKDAEFVEKEKNPLKQYQGPATYGSVGVTYPKTWSAYVIEENSSAPINAYFHPNVVPGVNSGTDYALRVEVLGQSYAVITKQYEGMVKSGKVTIAPYKSPKVAGVTGVRVDGEINTGQRGSMVLLPIRDKTLRVSTQSTQFLKDFDSIILANMTFEP